MIGRSGERGSGISVLAARDDDDDDMTVMVYVVFFEIIYTTSQISEQTTLSYNSIPNTNHLY